jgi:hypothetical protein
MSVSGRQPSSTLISIELLKLKVYYTPDNLVGVVQVTTWMWQERVYCLSHLAPVLGCHPDLGGDLASPEWTHNILSCVWLAIGGVCNGKLIYWTLTARSYRSSCQRGCPTKKRPQLSDSNLLTGRKYLVTSQRVGLAIKHTDWLIISRKLTSTLSSYMVWFWWNEAQMSWAVKHNLCYWMSNEHHISTDFFKTTIDPPNLLTIKDSQINLYVYWKHICVYMHSFIP